ncbi:hypothetical protein [[Clostridium] polysaccharolyticum]|uniref:Uncharacterized protein n=1 Tax=[Clostridium] polysaccharolyticum TaxID=29364 RepID=A0A1H9YI30_9FIRM|nr:hypothetical protein [[Clostridium] polysaccharolyticum]SES68238.1 hypothetical protein SAMN04487772_10211 [[Clostridium] polysaccharolyticum]
MKLKELESERNELEKIFDGNEKLKERTKEFIMTWIDKKLQEEAVEFGFKMGVEELFLKLTGKKFSDAENWFALDCFLNDILEGDELEFEKKGGKEIYKNLKSNESLIYDSLENKWTWEVR